MGSLKDLVGDVIDLNPPITVRPGTIILTFRHGGPRDVVRPGRKLRRGKGLPLTFSPQGLVLSTEDVPITADVKNIKLQEAYGLDRLHVELRVRLGAAGDFAGLKRYVATKGINFASLLDAEIRNELDLLARGALQDKTAIELHEAGNLTKMLRFEGAELLSGLFAIDSVQYVEPTFSAEFLRVQRAAAETEAEKAEILLKLEQLPLERNLEEGIDRMLAEKASRRGLSLLELENPELVAQAATQEHELKLEILRQLDSLRRGGGTDAVRAALDLIGRPTALPGAAAPVELTSPTPQVVAAPALAADLSKLRCDHTLARLWRRAGLPGEPDGLGLGGPDDDVTVLAVCTSQLPPGAAVDIRDGLAELVGTSSVITLDGVTSVADVVDDYLRARFPELNDLAASFECSEEGDTLVVGVSSTVGTVRPVLKKINDPDEDLLSPLRSVLPYDAIHIRLAEPA